jgi:hypothetical protein
VQIVARSQFAHTTYACLLAGLSCALIERKGAVKRQIKKFGVFQTAKVAALLYLVGSAIILEPLALAMFLLRKYGITHVAADAASRTPSPGFLMFLPVLYCVISFITVALMCWLYNIIAGKTGGIEIEFDQE